MIRKSHYIDIAASEHHAERMLHCARKNGAASLVHFLTTERGHPLGDESVTIKRPANYGDLVFRGEEFAREGSIIVAMAMLLDHHDLSNHLSLNDVIILPEEEPEREYYAEAVLENDSLSTNFLLGHFAEKTIVRVFSEFFYWLPVFEYQDWVPTVYTQPLEEGDAKEAIGLVFAEKALMDRDLSGLEPQGEAVIRKVAEARLLGHLKVRNALLRKEVYTLRGHTVYESDSGRREHVPWAGISHGPAVLDPDLFAPYAEPSADAQSELDEAMAALLADLMAENPPPIRTESNRSIEALQALVGIQFEGELKKEPARLPASPDEIKAVFRHPFMDEC